MKKSLNLALDFDDTYTADPDMWRQFIKLAHKRGHQVYICTMRYDQGVEKDEVEAEINGLAPVIYCCRTFKEKVCAKLGIKINIWIDDFPAGIQDQRDLIVSEYSTGRTHTVWDWLGEE